MDENFYKNKLLQLGYDIEHQFQTKIAYFFIIKEFNQKYVIKVLNNDYKYLFKNMKYYKILIHLNSPFILNPSDIYESNDICFIKTPLFDGISLRDFLKQIKRISKNKIFNIFEDIAQGIDTLHKNNYLHLDLNESNILINSEYQIKIHDFDFLRITTTQKPQAYLVDIQSFALIVFRTISLNEWDFGICKLNFEYSINSLDYSNCVNFYRSLNLK